MSTATLNDLMTEVKSLAHELNRRVDESDREQKARHEDLTSKNATTAAEYKQVLDRLNERINSAEDQVTQLKNEQMQAQIEANRPPAFAGKKQTRSDAHKAWMRAIKNHDKGASLSQEEKEMVMPNFMPRERKALYAADATTGGYFAATDFLDELIAYRLLISRMRAICRIQTTSAEKIQMPNLANDVTVYWASEQSSFSDSADPTTSMIEIPVHEIRALLKVSQQNLEDSQFNLEDFMKTRMMLGFVKKEGAAFITGSGTGQPQGIMSFPTKATTSYSGGSAGKNNVYDAIPYVLSGAASGKINADDILNVKMDLKSDYDQGATYIFTRGTLNTIRLFKDSQNRPLWQPFGGSNLPSTIYDTPYVEMPDMAEIASSAFPVAVGDFSYYMIVDRIQLAIRELDELFAVSGLIGFIARMRVGGQVLLSEAFRTLKVN
jgi:HK97 family phage major capsid protein